MVINANEARERTAKIREGQVATDMEKIVKRIESAVSKGDYESYVDFSLSLKELIIKELESQGFKFVSSGNVTHSGRYQIKISWK